MAPHRRSAQTCGVPSPFKSCGGVSADNRRPVRLQVQQTIVNVAGAGVSVVMGGLLTSSERTTAEPDPVTRLHGIGNKRPANELRLKCPLSTNTGAGNT